MVIYACVCICVVCLSKSLCVHVRMYAYLELPSTINQPPTPVHTHARTHARTHICTGYFRSLAPDGVSRSINYISAPAIKQGYYQAAAHRPGKAWPIKGCCDVGAGARSCDSNTEWQLMSSRDRRMERGRTDDWGWIQRRKQREVCGTGTRQYL